jgi:hypothetical protein
MECRRRRPRDCRRAYVWRGRGGSGHRRRRCGSRAGMSGLLCGGVDVSGDQKDAANSGHNGKRKPKLLGKHGAKLPLLHLPHIKNARVRETIRCPAPLFSAPRRCSFKLMIVSGHSRRSGREPTRKKEAKRPPLVADARDQ